MDGMDGGDAVCGKFAKEWWCIETRLGLRASDDILSLTSGPIL
jgi:hypothetical protein